MRRLVVALASLALLLPATPGQAHFSGWCGHESKKVYPELEVFDYHTNSYGDPKATGNFHHVTAYLYNARYGIWQKVHVHIRKCH